MRVNKAAKGNVTDRLSVRELSAVLHPRKAFPERDSAGRHARSVHPSLAA